MRDRQGVVESMALGVSFEGESVSADVLATDATHVVTAGNDVHNLLVPVAVAVALEPLLFNVHWSSFQII